MPYNRYVSVAGIETHPGGRRTMIDYKSQGFEVREDLVDSQNEAWRRLANPGTWCTGAHRVSIAEEARAARSCSFCAARKSALSPYAVEGAHETATNLSPAAVEAIHRTMTDPGRLTRRWYEEVLEAGLDDASFVELVSVVCVVAAVDGFARAIGAPAPSLPEPQPGEPSRERPACAKDDGAFAPTISADDGVRPEIGLYEPEAFTPNVGRGLSLVPEATRTAQVLMRAHYMPYHLVVTDFEPSERAIDRTQMELVAARVSAKNDCFY
jgi:alkylhydroperoxidase family enzyme